MTSGYQCCYSTLNGLIGIFKIRSHNTNIVKINMNYYEGAVIEWNEAFTSEFNNIKYIEERMSLDTRDSDL